MSIINRLISLPKIWRHFSGSQARLLIAVIIVGLGLLVTGIAFPNGSAKAKTVNLTTYPNKTQAVTTKTGTDTPASSVNQSASASPTPSATKTVTVTKPVASNPTTSMSATPAPSTSTSSTPSSPTVSPLTSASAYTPAFANNGSYAAKSNSTNGLCSFNTTYTFSVNGSGSVHLYDYETDKTPGYPTNTEDGEEDDTTFTQAGQSSTSSSESFATNYGSTTTVSDYFQVINDANGQVLATSPTGYFNCP